MTTAMAKTPSPRIKDDIRRHETVVAAHLPGADAGVPDPVARCLTVVLYKQI